LSPALSTVSGIWLMQALSIIEKTDGSVVPKYS